MMADQDDELDVIELGESLADVEKPPELPPGIYIGEITDVQKFTSGKGNLLYSVKFTIPTEEIPADMQDQFEDGANLYWQRQLVPTGKDRRALYNLQKFINAIGLDTATTTINPNDWMGQRAKLRVRLGKPFEGERRAEIYAIESAEDEVDEAPPRRTAPVEVVDEAPPRRAGRRAAR